FAELGGIEPDLGRLGETPTVVQRDRRTADLRLLGSGGDGEREQRREKHERLCHPDLAYVVGVGRQGRVSVSTMKLYSGPLSMFGAKAEIAAREKGLDVEPIMVPFEMKTLYQPKHPEVLRINPKRQVPVLIDDDLEIFDSTQIFEYFETVKPEPA